MVNYVHKTLPLNPYYVQKGMATASDKQCNQFEVQKVWDYMQGGGGSGYQQGACWAGNRLGGTKVMQDPNLRAAERLYPGVEKTWGHVFGGQMVLMP